MSSPDSLRVSRLISTQAPNTAMIWAAAITVETALTIGRFSDWRRIEKTQTGNVCSKPPVKNEISKLLNDQAKAKIEAACKDAEELLKQKDAGKDALEANKSRRGAR